MQGIQLFLIGPQHVGKSSVGALLANTLQLPFYDTDTIMLDIAKSEIQNITSQNEPHSPITIRTLFTLLGSIEFRALEAKAIAYLHNISGNKQNLTQQDTRKLSTQANNNQIADYVCATGGGFADNVEGWHLAETIAPKIMLQCDAETVWPRIIKHGIPSYLSSKSLSEISTEDLSLVKRKFVDLFNKRMRIYKEKANIVVDTTNLTIKEIVSLIIDTLDRY